MNARVLQLFLGLGTLLILAPAGGLSLPVQAGESHSFSRDIQPLLAKHCVLCHGPDDDSAGLRLDQHDRALAVLESGQRAIVPGQPEASALLQRVSATDPAVRMPPEGDPLTPREIEMLREWIRGGARFEEHWAFRPVKEPPLPRLHNVNWPRNPIDHFVLAPARTGSTSTLSGSRTDSPRQAFVLRPRRSPTCTSRCRCLHGRLRPESGCRL
ncbi:MAG: c-type cytochrome domain-containing protein [Planctomycetaceae bacterium]